ncbi:MAG: DUF2231 domain-containing protein [Mycobacteriales bacterium]
MLDEMFGIPAHPLLAHLPLILVPLAAITSVVAVGFQRHRKRLAWAAAGVMALALASVQVANASGESLERRVEDSDLLRNHISTGNTLRIFSVLLFVFLLVLAVLPQSSWTPQRAQRRRAAVAGVSLVVVILSIVCLVVVVRVGHSGTKSVWDGIPAPGGQVPSESAVSSPAASATP